MNFLIGQKYLKQKEFGKALNFFLNLEKNNLKDSKILFYLGIINYELNNFDKSIFYYDKFLKSEPNSISALHNLALVKQSIGQIDSAKKIYLKLIKLDKTKIRPYYGLYTLNENYLTQDNYDKIDKIVKNQKLNFYEKGIINFIFSKKEKKNKNYKKEIDYLKKFHSDIFNSNFEYNNSAQFYYNNIISKNYKKIKISNLDNYYNNRLNPIFIIGLPRSGSTLIESILTSGPQKIRSYGESHVINMSILEQIGPKIYNKDFNIENFLFKINVNSLEQSVLKRYSDFNFDSQFKDEILIDKSLENFFNIEIILNLFPRAKFLNTFRNPIDSIISIYQSMLPELSWTHKIEDILYYLDNYYKILKYFKLKYPAKILDINLEKFTENSLEEAKKVFKFCNLNWDIESLNFYKRSDLYSKTLSFAQVRKKISKYDSKKYMPYLYLVNEYKKKYKWINFD